MDLLFIVAHILQDGGELVLVRQLLREVVSMNSDVLEVKNHSAGAFWILAAVEAEIGADEASVTDLQAKATEILGAIEGIAMSVSRGWWVRW